MFFSSKWNPDGLHVYVTGGSNGLGLSLAILLVKNGAHVSIVARNQERLNKALAKLEECRVRPEQILKSYSFSLDNAKDSAEALRIACLPHNNFSPDAVFACAGSSRPMFLMDMEEKDLSEGMTNGYWVQAWTAFAAAKLMARQERKGRIVLVSSTLGYMSFLGWSSYAPAKHALRGLADSLQSELLLYGIDVHIFFPGTMYTPGYEEEMKTKPKITAEIEGTEDGMSPDQAALALFRGVQKGLAHITADFNTSLFRASTRGSTQANNFLLDGLYDSIAFISIPFWRSSVDKRIVSHRREHHEYLRQKGFFG